MTFTFALVSRAQLYVITNLTKWAVNLEAEANSSQTKKESSQVVRHVQFG